MTTASTPAPTTDTEQYVDVTSVMTDIVRAKAIRDTIKALKVDLEAHESEVRRALGPAVHGVDGDGEVVVSSPVRNRSNLVAARVKERLGPDEYADCLNVTEYRPLEFK